MEEPQPVAAPEPGAGAPAEPAPGATATAAPPPEPQSQGQPAQADDTAAWLQSKGVDPNDPEAFQKVAQMAYHSEKQMTKATQEASELRKSLTPTAPQPQDGYQGDSLVQEMYQDWKTDKMLNEFKDSHKDWTEYRGAMSGLLGEAVSTPHGVFTREQLVNAGILSLHDIYLQAKGSTPVDTTQIQTQAQQQVLQTLANTQRAGGGTAHASDSNPQTPTEDPINAAIRKNRG